MAKRGKYSNWVKSFGKSVKFGAKDVLTELAPSMAETTGSMADDVRELRQDLRKLRSNKRQIINYLLGEEEQFSKYGKELVKNAKSSAKTGKLYDPNRADKAVMKAMGFDDFDMDFGDTGSFDMNGGSDSDFGDFTPGSTNIVNMTGPSTEAMQSVALEVGKTNEAISDGFRKMSASSKNNFAISEALEKRFHTERMSQLTAINNNLVSIVQYNNETTSKFVNASLEFYDKNLSVLTSINEAMLRLSPVPKSRRELAKQESPVDMFMNGGFSLKGYSRLVAQNARKSFQNSMLGSMAPFMNNEMLLADMSANPWSIPLKWGIESLIPDRFKKSLTGLDKSYNAFIPALLTKLGHYKGNDTLTQFISEIFGIKTTTRAKRFDSAAYDKGPIPFDGETKAAITRAIPGYLSRQTALLEIIAGTMTHTDGSKLESMLREKTIVFKDAGGVAGGSFMRYADAQKMQKREEKELVSRSYTESNWDLKSKMKDSITTRTTGIDIDALVQDFQMGLTESGEELDPKNIRQLKRFIFRGENGKEPTDEQLKDAKLQRKAELIRAAYGKMPISSQLAMYGAERHEARTKLNNYRTAYGSDAENGAGTHTWLSKVSEGAITNLYSDKDYRRYVNERYLISKDDYGNYVMPRDMIEKYNKDQGYSRIKGTYLYTAEKIYKDILEHTGGGLGGATEFGRKSKPSISIGGKDVTFDEALKRYGVKTGEDGKMTVTDEGRALFQKDFGEATLRKDAKSLYKGLQKQFRGAKTKIVDTGAASTAQFDQFIKESEQRAESGENKTLTQTIREIIQMPFNKMADMFDAVNKKMHDIIFGKDGLGGNLTDMILGKKNKDTGRREGGWFSSPINYVKDTFKSTKEYLFGDGDKKEGILSNSLQKFGTLMKKYFLGNEKGATKNASIIDTMKSTIVRGFSDISTVLFGHGGGKKGREKSMEEAKEMFAKAMPDIAKGMGAGAVVGTVAGLGGFGLLGSLFLPGGPIGGALVGGAIGLLKQSKGFREMLFGKETTDENGKVKRVGGLISDKVQKFFKAKKVPILGGAAMGVMSTAMGHGIAFGLMPSVAVGAFGPVIAGAAWGLLSHSRAFRRVLFGKEVRNPDGTIKKVGGLINGKIMGRMKAMLPRGIVGALGGMASMGVVSQLGLVGNMVALGPIPAAIAGAGLGIATASRKFTKYMFGYTDASGKYHSGALDRMKNFFTWEIFEPMKLRFTKELFEGRMWIRKNVFGPVRRAVEPIKAAFNSVGKYIKNKLKTTLDPITAGFKAIFTTIADNLKTIFKPIVNVVKTMSSWMLGRFKSAMKFSINMALLPLRAVGGLARMAVEKENYTSGVSRAFGGVKEAFKSGTGLLGAMGNLGKAIVNPEDEFAEFDKHEKQTREAEKRAEIRGNAVIQARYAKMREMQDKIRAGGYNLTEDQIKEMQKNAESSVKRDEKVMSEAEQSADVSIQLARIQTEQGAETNKLLAQIVKNTAAANEANGVSADDDASKVDEQKKREEAEEAAAEQQKQLAEDTHATAEAVKKMADGADGKDGKKKGWFWSFIGGIGKIASGVFGLFSSIGTVGAAALGIYGLLKMVFGDKSKGGTSEKLAHSTQAGIATEYGAKKLTGFFANNANHIRAIGNTIMDAGKWAKDKLLNKTLSKDDWYKKFGQGLDAKSVEKGYAEYLKNPTEKGRTLLGKAVDKVKGGISTVKQFASDVAGEKFGKLSSKAQSLFNKSVGKAESPSKVKKIATGIVEGIGSALGKFLESPTAVKVFGTNGQAAKTFKDAILELGRKLMDPEIMAKLRKTFPGKVAKAIGLTGTATTGLGLVVNVAFGVYDGITGAIEADRLFDVNPEDVTFKMRLISGFTNAFFGLPPMLWIDLILTAASFGMLGLSDTIFGKAMAAAGFDLQDFDHRKLFAQYLLNLISDDEEVQQNEAAQQKFETEYKAYLDKHKLNAGDFSKEQYRAEMGNKSIWQKYGAPIIDKVLGVSDGTTPVKSFGERISGWMDDMTKWFRDAVKAITSFSPIGWFKELIGLPQDWSLFGAFNRIGQRLDSWLPENNTGFHPIDRTTSFASRQWEKAKGAASKVKNYFFGSANGPYLSQNDARWKNKRFGSGTFGDEACGPISFAMISRMLGRDVNPEQAARLSTIFQQGNGVSSAYFANAARAAGLGYKENQSGRDVVGALARGIPTILGGTSTNPNSPFYGNGHYVVAKGMDSEGNVGILNPTGRSKNKSVNIRQLLSETINNRGYSGSFIGAGRMSLAEAQKVQNEVQGDKAKLSAIKELPGSSDFSNLKELEPSDIKKLTAGDTAPAVSNMAMLDSYNQRNRARNSKAAINRQLDIAKKAKNNPNYNLTGSKPNANNGKLGFSGLLMGLGMGLKNLFGAIWGGTKYQNVSVSDVLGGFGSMFKGLLGGKNIGVSGKGCDTGIRAAQCALAHPDGEQWMGTVTTDSNIQCDSYAREIYKEAGLEMPRMVVTDEDFKARSAYFPNDGSYEPELGDLIDWPKHVGIYVGGHNVNSRQSKGGVHTLSFEDAEKIWGPIHGFGSVSKYTGEPVHEVHGGGGGSFDSASGNLEDKQKVWSYLVNDLGMNRAGAAGVMGNIQKESSFRTAAIGDGGTSGGLVQWHDESPGVGRFTNLKNFAASQGLPFESLDAQLGYLGQELNDGYRGVYNKVKNASSVGGAVHDWVYDFERPYDKPGEVADRTPIAQSYYDNTSDFVGGANFMSGGYSGNPLANLVTGGLFSMVNRYNERGRQKKVAELKKLMNAGVTEDRIPANLLKYKKYLVAAPSRPGSIATNVEKYVEAHNQTEVPKPLTVANANIASARVLPSKVDTGGASMDDLLISIRALDSHRELEQIIGYLSIIAKTGAAAAVAKPKLDPRTERQLKTQIDRVKNDARAGSPSNGISPQRYKDLLNTMEGLDGYLNKDMFTVAVDIAKGGNFRTS